jgi:hypothetical protein
MLLFFNITSAMVSKHSEPAKRQSRDHYERFAFSSSHTAPPSAFDDSIMEMWEVPPRPSTRLEEASFDDSSSAS